MYTCSYDRMKDKIETFSKFGDAGHGGITRYSLSPEAIQARNEFRRRMEAIGAAIEVDDVACMYATLPGSDPDAKRIVMGSHVDSVKNGGNYDGILGVMSAMEVLETVAEKKIPHKHPLTAMIWTNEEGSLYPPFPPLLSLPSLSEQAAKTAIEQKRSSSLYSRCIIVCLFLLLFLD